MDRLTREVTYTQMRESETEALRRALREAREELKVALAKLDRYRNLEERKLRSVR